MSNGPPDPMGVTSRGSGKFSYPKTSSPFCQVTGIPVLQSTQLWPSHLILWPVVLLTAMIAFCSLSSVKGLNDQWYSRKSCSRRSQDALPDQDGALATAEYLRDFGVRGLNRCYELILRGTRFDDSSFSMSWVLLVPGAE